MTRFRSSCLPLLVAAATAGWHESGFAQRVEAGAAPSTGDPAIDGQSFAATATADPLLALERVLAIEDEQDRRRAFVAALPTWTAGDPVPVLDAIRALDDRGLRAEWLDSLLSWWSTRDTAAALGYITTLDDWDLAVPEVRGISNIHVVFPISPDSDLATLFDQTAALPPKLARIMRQQIIGRLAERDPPSATDYLAQLPADEARAAAITIARPYSEIDRISAIDWARGLDMPEILELVLSTIAMQDPQRALDAAIASGNASTILGVAGDVVLSPLAQPSDLMATLRALPELAGLRGWLDNFMLSWAYRDPEGALDWLVSQRDDIPESVYRAAAGRLGQRPDLAIEYADRVPAAMRDTWIATTVSLFTSLDPSSAERWLGSYREDPAYLAAVGAVARGIAQTDAEAAGALLAANRHWDDMGLAMEIVGRWVRVDRAAAGEWALGIPNPDTRLRALMTLGSGAVANDPGTAELWVSSLPVSADRDRILSSMITSVFNDDPALAARLFALFQSDDSRQGAAFMAATMVMREDEAEARRLMGQYVTNPELRAQFEQYLAPRDDSTRPACVGFFRPVC